MPRGLTFQRIPEARGLGPDNSGPFPPCLASLCEQSSVGSRSCSHSRRIPKMEQCTPGLGLSGRCSGAGPQKAVVWAAFVAVLSVGISMKPGVGLAGGGQGEGRVNKGKPAYPVNRPGCLWLDSPCGEDTATPGSGK